MLDKAQALADELARLRRDIHRHPELAFREVRTAALVADTLREIGGFSVRTGVGITGVVGDLGSGDGPTIAIRADMDALPILEANATDYRSTHDGQMHACGHDGHTAMLLGVAHLLKHEFATGGLRGRVRLLFQPAEEDEGGQPMSGAPMMLRDGALDGVDAVIALHVDSMQPFGKVTMRDGWDSAAADQFKAWITGTGGHGAYPHEATDPLWMLAPVLTALHGIVSRRVDPQKPAVVTVGQIHGGTASNVIPPEVFLHGTMRSYDDDTRALLEAEVERAISIVRSLGGDYRMEVSRGYPAGKNSPLVSGWLARTATDLLGADALDPTPPGMGAEDFAYMTAKVPGAMFHLGAAVGDIPRAHHTPVFDIDERCLPVGAAILAETARRFLAGEIKL
ncbi:MAG TPA: M20 family metallopeptidase [Kouleothrix sp.]|uniref:M20 metallopeptidase family protein n=1 Tax=Kouleothrix sp. TaxID=2779161 RepID=UPI002C657927|nr:M20 family metallopeptidase [Kouleothrix sp.]HRC74219.1 M20 family metallopeptidase [Kouleothrix sp.]